MKPLMALLAGVFLALAGLVVSCTGGEEEARPATTTSVVTGAQGGVTPPFYEEPVLLRDGDYLPPGFSAGEVWERGVAADQADSQQPDFEGEVSGVRLYSLYSNADTRQPERCVVAEFVQVNYIKTSYLPPGTYALGPQFAGLCPDGSAAFIMQEFSTKHGSFDVIFRYGEPVLLHDASPARVSSQSIGNIQAVVIAPVLPREGFGRGWGAYATENGVIIVDARMLPLTEMLEILRGITCSVC